MEPEIQDFSLARACSTCRYWENRIKVAGAAGGECRYSPPMMGGDGVAAWPATHGDDWCRCWKSDAEPAKRKPGRPVEHKPEELLPVITEILYHEEGLGRVDLYKRVYAVRPLSFATFCKVLDALVESGGLECFGVVWWVKGQRAALEAEATPTMEV